MENGKISRFVNHAQVLSFSGAGLVGISVFLSVVSATFLFRFSLMELSTAAGIGILLGALVSAYGVVSRRYEMPVIAGNGLILFLMAALVMYTRMVSEMAKGFFGTMMQQSISLNWGIYVLGLGAILLILGAAAGSLGRREEGESSLFDEYKVLLFSKLERGSVKIPVWVVSLVYGALLSGLLMYGIQTIGR